MKVTRRAFGPFIVLDADTSRRGGTAEVYRAKDTRDGSIVALKVASAREGAADAIRREAATLRELRHPGIVGYVGEGEDDAGTPYVATEWLEGESLQERLARGPLGVDDTLLLARELANTLAFVHQSGFVHRDLKPGNVMLQGCAIERPKLVDFGFAARLQEKPALQDAFRRVLEVMGTPAYMAPEQARGDEEPDTRADVFSFGAMLYRCLTGHVPFGGRDAIATLSRVLFEDPKPIRELAPKVPERVATLIARTMRKEPSRRPKDGAALAQALRELDGEQGPASIAPMPIARTIVCVVLCRFPPMEGGGKDVLAAWGNDVRVVREAGIRDGAELRLLGEGNVALFFIDDAEPTHPGGPVRGVAVRAADSALSLARAIPGGTFGVAAGYGTKNESAAELVERARSLIDGETGVIVDAVVDALLPEGVPRELTKTGRRIG